MSPACAGVSVATGTPLTACLAAMSFPAPKKNCGVSPATVTLNGAVASSFESPQLVITETGRDPEVDKGSATALIWVAETYTKPHFAFPTCTHTLARLVGRALFVKSVPMTTRMTDGSAKPLPKIVKSASAEMAFTGGECNPPPTTELICGSTTGVNKNACCC